MARERMEQARAQIKAKQYQQARRTLTGVDHPTARAWLAKLNEIAPEVPEDDPFSVFDAPATRPIVKPADAIFDPNPRFDPLPKPKAKRRTGRLLLIGLVLIALLIGGTYAVLLTVNGPGLAACSDSQEGRTALKDFLDTAETAVATARIGLGPVILELQRHQQRYDQASHPTCTKPVVEKISDGMRNLVDGIRDFAAQRASSFRLQQAHDYFKEAYDANFLIASDVRLANVNLFIFHIAPTATPYRELATQRPNPTDAPTPTPTAIG